MNTIPGVTLPTGTSLTSGARGQAYDQRFEILHQLAVEATGLRADRGQRNLGTMALRDLGVVFEHQAQNARRRA